MTAPRLEIDLSKVRHNAQALVASLNGRGISVAGVTKASLGSPRIARVLLEAGVHALGDSRIENLASMRRAGVQGLMILIRSPMLSQVDLVVAHSDVSFNTELEVIGRLSRAAVNAARIHRIVLMVELGDLREGILPADLEGAVREVIRLPNIEFQGIGTNLACRSGVSPDPRNMSALSALATSIELGLGVKVATVSGGNSANLSWALSTSGVGRINELRLGESILLGRETLHRQPIEGLHTDAITLVAEVIESKLKPSRPWGTIAQTAFGVPIPQIDRGDIPQIILALGHQDTDPHGLLAVGLEVLGHSSDHLIATSASGSIPVGAEVRFQVNYSALVRAMASPYVAKVMQNRGTLTDFGPRATSDGPS